MKNDTIISYKLADIKPITHNTRQFTFPIPTGVPFDFYPGDHMKLYPDPTDPVEWRPYTPTTTPDIKDHFQLIIKKYPDGIVSRYMHDRQAGDYIYFSGPHEGGHFVNGMATEIGLVAGGTGITPMISMIRYIMMEILDTKVSLIFSNKTVDDIILKEEFDKYETERSNFKRYYIVDTPPPDWTMGTGRINIQVLKDRLPAPSDQTVVFVCGPPMMQINLRKNLIELGYSKDKIIFP
jgi:cytochrome-b5 reductase